MDISQEFIKDSGHSLSQNQTIANLYYRNEITGDKGLKGISSGDFLSRLWFYFGTPDDIGYEGFTYCIKHKKSNLVFLACCTGSGPTYTGDVSRKKEFYEILKSFEDYLQNAKPADCEIEIETDFGHLKIGAKNGTPFDIEEK
jgi:hypothetical protein